MGRNGLKGVHNEFSASAPLTAIERERRAAVLLAVNGHSSDPIDIRPDDTETFPNKSTTDESGDERNFGKLAAQVLRDAKRSVALASSSARLAVFEQAGAALGEALAGQWLPKNAMVDRLRDIAVAHDNFGRGYGDIEIMIGAFCERIPAPAPISSVVFPRYRRNRRNLRNCLGGLSAIAPVI
jgi:hypothetical protein